MLMCCKNCGNSDRFASEVVQYIRKEVRRTFIGGDLEDYKERKKQKWVEDELRADPTCLICSSEDINTFSSDKERDIFIYEHTNKKGFWNKKKLSKNSRNAGLRAKQVAKNL